MENFTLAEFVYVLTQVLAQKYGKRLYITFCFYLNAS